MRARWAIVPAVSSHKAPSSQLGEGMLGFAVSLGVPPPDHNVISGLSLSSAAMSPGAIILPHLLLSHLLSKAPSPCVGNSVFLF